MKVLRIGSRGDEVKTLQNALHLISDGIFGSLTLEAVKEFQRAHGLDADGIVGPKTWAALGVTGSPRPTIRKSGRVINEIIVHCTATAEGRDATVEAIRRYHVTSRGWSDIGYHYIVYRDGTIHLGRDIDKAGAHCTGHNPHSIGVVYVGGLTADGKTPKDTRTPQQREALRWLLKSLKEVYPKATIHGHREFANKACPCFDAKKEYSDL